MAYSSTKRFLIAIILLAITALFCLPLLYQHLAEERLARQSMMSAIDPDVFQQWVSLLDSPKIKSDDKAFEKIDFAFPGEAGYGTSPNEEFFNPQGPFKASLLKHPSIHGRPLFNVRRYITKPDPARGLKAMEHKALYVLLPMWLPCGTPTFTLVIPPDNHTVVTDPEAISDNCFKITDGLSYQFIPLAWKSRSLREGH